MTGTRRGGHRKEHSIFGMSVEKVNNIIEKNWLSIQKASLPRKGLSSTSCGSSTCSHRLWFSIRGDCQRGFHNLILSVLDRLNTANDTKHSKGTDIIEIASVQLAGIL
jgi:hypothetical protein